MVADIQGGPTRRAVLGGIAAGLLCARGGLAAEDFDLWLQELRRDARAAGVRPATLDAALAGVRPIPRVIELDRRQPEGRLSFVEYRRRVLSEQRVTRGRELLERHAALLRRVAGDFGVPPRVIVALWGVESSFGSFTGDFPIIAALATLAHDGRRSDFFRGELIAALRILDNGDVRPERMRGSWAGAMGQSQFMPSSYLNFAVDYDGDGRRDIWDSLPDVFASIANYLAGAGWSPGYTWGREVRVPAGIGGDLEGLDVRRSLAGWQSLGLRTATGQPLPDVAIDASLLRTDDGRGPAFLVYDNYRVFLRWNRSHHFALTVGTLADRLQA